MDKHEGPLFFGIRNAAFTVIELMITVAIVILLAVLSVPFVSTSVSVTNLNTSVDQANDALREAQSAAMSRRGTGKYGVHFEQTKFVFFEGATYSAFDTNNSVHDLTGDLAITVVTLSPGGSCTVSSGGGNCDVHFRNHLGTPVESGSVTFTSTSQSAPRVLTINAVGMIDSN